MYCLFFNIASHAKSIALVNEQEVLGLYETSDRIGDSELIPAIQKVLAEASITFKDLDRIAIVLGPGGFTSLRIAVACANTLADQLQIPSAGVHLSDFLRSRCSEEDVLWMHSTKKDQLFISGGQSPEPTLLQTDKVISKVTTLKSEYWVGELIPEHQHLVGTLKEATLLPLSETLPQFLSSLEYSAEILLPWYGRGW